MRGLIKKIITYNHNLKVVSAFIGFSMWYGLIHMVPMQYSYRVPICFDDELEHVECSSDTITITLSSIKAHFYGLDKQNLAFHITKQDILSEKNTICVHAEKLLLPPSFKLIDCCPATITITT